MSEDATSLSVAIQALPLMRPVFNAIVEINYDVAECAGCDYSSLIVVAEDSPYEDVLDMRGKTAVANGPETHSGMNSLRHLVAPKNIDGSFFCRVIYGGAHVDSMKLLREKRRMSLQLIASLTNCWKPTNLEQQMARKCWAGLFTPQHHLT